MIDYYKNLSLENLFYTDENGVLQEEELNVLVEMKKVPHAVKNLCKMIRQSTIDEIIGLRRIGGEGNKIENLERVNPDKIK